MNTPYKLQGVYFEHDNCTFSYITSLYNGNSTTRQLTFV